MGIHQIISPAHKDALPLAGRASDPWASQDVDALEAALSHMENSFSSDFVEGRMGARHNTFQHRARIIRQMTHQFDEQRGRLS